MQGHKQTLLFIITLMSLIQASDLFGQVTDVLMPLTHRAIKPKLIDVRGPIFRTKSHYIYLDQTQTGFNQLSNLGFRQKHISTDSIVWDSIQAYQYLCLGPINQNISHIAGHERAVTIISDQHFQYQRTTVHVIDSTVDKIRPVICGFDGIGTLYKTLCNTERMHFFQLSIHGNHSGIYNIYTPIDSQGYIVNSIPIHYEQLVPVNNELVGLTMDSIYHLSADFAQLEKKKLPQFSVKQALSQGDSLILVTKQHGVWVTQDFGAHFSQVTSVQFDSIYPHRDGYFFMRDNQLFFTKDFVSSEKIYITSDSIVGNIKPVLTNSKHEFGVLFENGHIMVTQSSGKSWNEVSWLGASSFQFAAKTYSNDTICVVNHYSYDCFLTKNGVDYHQILNDSLKVNLFSSEAVMYDNKIWLITGYKDKFDKHLKGALHRIGNQGELIFIDSLPPYVYKDDVFISNSHYYVRFYDTEARWMRQSFQTGSNEFLNAPQAKSFEHYISNLIAISDTLLLLDTTQLGTVIFKSVDGGQTWDIGTAISPVKFEYTSAFRVTKNVVYLTIRDIGTWISSDRGNSWSQTGNNGFGDYGYFKSFQKGWTYDGYPRLYLTDDFGASWYRLHDQTDRAVGYDSWIHKNTLYYTDYLDTLYSMADTVLFTLLSCPNTIKTQLPSQYICPGDTLWVLNQTLTLPGIYFDTLVSAVGCDSIISIELIQKQLTAPIIQQTLNLCGRDSVNFLNQTYTLPGYYQDSVGTNSNCSGIQHYQIHIIDSATAELQIINITHPTGLGASDGSITVIGTGAPWFNYKWYNTQGDLVSTFATATQLTEGAYYVKLLYNQTCELKSNLIWLSHLLSTQEEQQNQVTAYPNPGTNSIIISSSLVPIMKVEVFSLSGQILFYQELMHESELMIDTSKWPKGNVKVMVFLRDGKAIQVNHIKL